MGWVHTALPKNHKPWVCLLRRQTKKRPQDKRLRVFVLPLKLLTSLGAVAHLLLPTGIRLPHRPPPALTSCGPLATPAHFNVQTQPEISVHPWPGDHQIYVSDTGQGLWGDVGRQGLMGRQDPPEGLEATRAPGEMGSVGSCLGFSFDCPQGACFHLGAT